jgi:hypothetical protein
MSINGNPTDTNAADPFNPASLRLDQSFAEKAGVKKHLTTVPVRRPNKQDFVRIHPDLNYCLGPTGIIELKEDRETYLVLPSMANILQGEFAFATLYTAITRQGVLFIWPVKLPGPDGKHNPWHQSAAEAAERAKSRWVRMTSNMHLGAYEIFESSGNWSDPEWPELPFQEILKIAFRGRIVDKPDHPLFRRLRGMD